MSGYIDRYWRGKRVIITGASSGLGKAVTSTLAPLGVHFGLFSRRKENMEELAEQLRESPSTFHIRCCDVRVKEEIFSAVEKFSEEQGGIDAAWINAGIGGSTTFGDWNWDFAEDIIDTNLKGAMYTTHACLEKMVPQGAGTIVGVSSAASMQGLPGRSVYSLSKIALNYYLESLATELPFIQFTTIMPGFVDTPINSGNPNRFWLMQPEEAAPLMIRAVARKKSTYTYPVRMKLLYTLIHALPSPLYRWLGRKLFNLSRPGEKSDR